MTSRMITHSACIADPGRDSSHGKYEVVEFVNSHGRVSHVTNRLKWIDVRVSNCARNVKDSYCAVYNLTERRFVAPFENLTLFGLMMGRRGRERNGGIGYGATIQAGLFAIDSQALPPGATTREERDVGRIR